MASNNDYKFPVQMASVPMEIKLSFDVRFIFLILGILRPFRRFIKVQLAINPIPLSPLVFHMRYRNLHNHLFIRRMKTCMDSPVVIMLDLDTKSSVNVLYA